MNKLKKLLFKIKLHRAGEYQKASVYATYQGVKFGKNTRITGFAHFGSEGYLIEIGDNVTITNGVVFHTHDGGVGILRKKYPGINIFKPIKIGDSVFIGGNSIILPGVSIGNNVIIGAGSVVTKNIPSNAVVAGNPARFIKSIDEYEDKVLKDAMFINRNNSLSEQITEIKNQLNIA